MREQVTTPPRRRGDDRGRHLIPAFHRASGYHRMNLPAGGVMPYARLPGFNVGSVVVTTRVPVPVVVPPEPNRVPMYDPGSPIAYRFPMPNAGPTATGATTVGGGVPSGFTGATMAGIEVTTGMAVTMRTGEEVG